MAVITVDSASTIPLRQKVLRPGLPREQCVFPRDDDSIHLGYSVGGNLVSILSAHPESSARYSEVRQWRLRGMATDPAMQGRGYGAELMHALLDACRERGVERLWCNARERAIPFYQRLGFSVDSELFEIEGVGPHKVMSIRI